MDKNIFLVNYLPHNVSEQNYTVVEPVEKDDELNLQTNDAVSAVVGAAIVETIGAVIDGVLSVVGDL
jgi:hypothetical protein